MAAEKPKASNLTVLVKYQDQEIDEDLSQECQDRIATLPTETNRFAIQLCQYQSFWFPKELMQGVLNCQNRFQAHDSDIFLVTSPKSGTTWLKALVFAIINRKTYYPSPIPDPTRTGQPHPLLTTNPHFLIPSFAIHLQQKNKLDLSSFPSPRIFASHLPYVSLSESMKQSRCKIVYLCRNPKDLFVSLWHFMSRVKPETQGSNSIEDSFEEFCQGVSIYGPFWDQVLGYYRESLERPGKTTFLRYEELKNEPVTTLKDLADFMGYGFSKEEENGDVIGGILKLCSFENLSSLEVNKTGNSMFGIENKHYFRHGVVGDWKNFLTVDMEKRLNVITQEKLGKHGLKF